jgi:methylated-DNA-[protein]-cysteine S-methyltransferase
MARARAEVVRMAHIDTPLGVASIAWGEHGLRRIEIAQASRKSAATKLEQQLGAVLDASPPRPIARALAKLAGQFAGRPTSFADVALDLRGLSKFRVAVYRALQQVPAGQTVSYSELARRVGSPRSARAIGRALATNPFAVIVPCHRVLARDGSLGGFSAPGGAATKARLLEQEGVVLSGKHRDERVRPVATVATL